MLVFLSHVVGMIRVLRQPKHGKAGWIFADVLAMNDI